MPRVLLFTGCVNQPLGYAPAPTGQGISSFFVDSVTGETEAGPVYTEIVNPTFVALSGDGRRLAAVSETEKQPEGLISLFAVHADTGNLTLLGRQSTRGAVACHCGFDGAGARVATANYSNGRPGPGNAISVHRIDGNTLGPALTDIIHTGSGPDAKRQKRSHAHCVRWTPDHHYLAVVDLGIDSVRLYRASDFSFASEVDLPAGSGPRHIVFNPQKRVAYVMAELQTGVTTLAYEDGYFAVLDTQPVEPSLPGGSGIVLAPGGTHLFVGDRGNRAIARFDIDPANGIARYAASTPSGGDVPRDLAFGAEGKVLAVANVGSDVVQLFTHGSDGTLTPLSAIATGAPTAVAFL